MKKAGMVLVALMGLASSAALAHGPNGHPADPNLHIGNAYNECYVKFAPELTQAAFQRFVREFGSVSAFKPMAPPTTLGKWGVEVAVEQFSFSVEEKADAWNDTFAHIDAYHELGSEQSIPQVKVRMGVTKKIDIGAFYTKNPDANYGWAGLDVKYGLLQQREAKPIDLAVRGAYTKTLYVDDMDMHTLSADMAAGRTFWRVFTPYLGVGSDVVWARETSDAVDLSDETQFVPRGFGGAELRFWHVGLGVEGEVGTLNRYQVKVAAVF